MLKMTDQEIVELAGILVNEHGHAAMRAAQDRLAQHRPGSDGYRLWMRITAEVARLLREPGVHAKPREYSG
jgi:hypothetical protein